MPVLVTVTVCAALVLLRSWFPNETLEPETVLKSESRVFQRGRTVLCHLRRIAVTEEKQGRTFGTPPVHEAQRTACGQVSPCSRLPYTYRQNSSAG